MHKVLVYALFAVAVFTLWTAINELQKSLGERAAAIEIDRLEEQAHSIDGLRRAEMKESPKGEYDSTPQIKALIVASAKHRKLAIVWAIGFIFAFMIMVWLGRTLLD